MTSPKLREVAAAFCAVCTDELPLGHMRTAPLGKGNAMVRVCNDCLDTHPRDGSYSFDSIAAPALTGNGNRRKGAPQ